MNGLFTPNISHLKKKGKLSRNVILSQMAAVPADSFKSSSPFFTAY